MAGTWKALALACATLSSAALLGSATAASAQEKMLLGYTAVADYVGAFVAADQGLFKKHGLDIELQLVSLNSTLPAAVQSNSIQIEGPTPSVFQQAVDGGLDHVVISGNTELDPTSKAYGVVARDSAGIKTAKDFEGKKVGVPGIGAFLQVIFRKWLLDQGADATKVQFVEVSFPTMNDVLKAGTVDAVVTGEPVMARMIAAGTGQLVTNMASGLPPRLPVIFFAATRSFVNSHPKLPENFRAALADARDAIAKDPDMARAAIAKYTKLPAAAVAGIPMPKTVPDIDAKQLQDWVDIMSAQKMLETKLDTAKLIAK